MVAGLRWRKRSAQWANTSQENDKHNRLYPQGKFLGDTRPIPGQELFRGVRIVSMPIQMTLFLKEAI